jgi:rhodanese-related sulfurtransferase
MPKGIDRHEVRRLLTEEHAQLIEVLPAAKFEEEHLPGAKHPAQETESKDGEAA